MPVIGVGTRPVLVYNKAWGPGCIANTDEVNPVYVSINRVPDSDSDQIPPLGALAVDGSQDYYSATLEPFTVQLQSMPGTTNWTPSPAQVAIQIAALGLATSDLQVAQETSIPDNISTTGVPLLTLPNVIASASAATLAGGATAATPFTDITQPGYDFVIQAEIAAGATKPWLIVELDWIDTSTSFTVRQDRFYMAVTSNGANILGGHGPTHADQVSVSLVNLDPAQTITYTYSLTQNSRVPDRDDWRQVAFNGQTGLTTAPSDPWANVLLAAVPTIGAAGVQAYVLPFWAGKVRFTQQQNSQPCRIFIINNASAAAGVTTETMVFDSGTIAAGPGQTAEIFLPRANCELQWFNEGTASAAFSLSAIAEEY